MKKKLAAGLASACLVAALGVGATLAYYTSTTEAVKNTFTIGNVKIDLLEPEWDPDNGKELFPGAEVEKNPFIKNVGAGAGYMMLKVDGMKEMEEQGFTVKNGDADGYNYAKWILVDEKGNVLEQPADHALVDGYYVYADGAVESGAQTEALFTSVVFDENAVEVSGADYQVIGKYHDEKGYYTYKDLEGNVIEENKNRTPDMDEEGNVLVKYFVEGDDDHNPADGYASYSEAEAHVLAEHNEQAGFVFDLTVQGFAIQSENVEFATGGTYVWVNDLVK